MWRTDCRDVSGQESSVVSLRVELEAAGPAQGEVGANTESSQQGMAVGKG